MEIEVANDWLDYVTALGGIASVAIALAAFVLARKSAKDSARSADAAEETAKTAAEEAEQTRILASQAGDQLEIMRREHAAFLEEQARRPELAVDFDDWIDEDPELVRGRIINNGASEARAVLIRLIAPQTVAIVLTNARGQTREIADPVPDSSTQFPAHGAQFDVWSHSWRADIPPHQEEVFHARFPTNHYPPLPIQVGLEVAHDSIESPIWKEVVIGSG